MQTQPQNVTRLMAEIRTRACINDDVAAEALEVILQIALNASYDAGYDAGFNAGYDAGAYDSTTAV